MISFSSKDGNPVCEARLRGVGVYLDNDSLIELAKDAGPRRAKFVHALTRGGTLLFSYANVIEIAGPQGSSAIAVRDLLSEVGANWIPLQLNPWTVTERERNLGPERAPVSENFLLGFYKERATDLSRDGDRILDLSSDSFFRLDAVLEWVQERRDSIRETAEMIDTELRTRLRELRQEFDRDNAVLDRKYPSMVFDARWPGTFVFFHLMRTLVREAKAFQFKDHDSLDLCHAVLAAAYGNLVTLDKQWKRRVELLPKPNQVAKVYYRPEVDELVDELERTTA